MIINCTPNAIWAMWEEAGTGWGHLRLAVNAERGGGILQRLPAAQALHLLLGKAHDAAAGHRWGRYCTRPCVLSYSSHGIHSFPYPDIRSETIQTYSLLDANPLHRSVARVGVSW